jgi:hypothetical protein
MDVYAMLKGEKQTPYFNLGINKDTTTKVTRRVAHEINGMRLALGVESETFETEFLFFFVDIFVEKRKLEEAELEGNKKIKTEGDLSEDLIRQIAHEVDAEFTNMENDVSQVVAMVSTDCFQI